MNSYIESLFNNSRLIYFCDCGYSTREYATTTTNKTVIDQNNKGITTNHT